MKEIHIFKPPLRVVIITATIICASITATNGKTISETTDNPQALFIRNFAKLLSTDLNSTVEEELGISVIEDLYSKLKYVSESQDYEKLVSKFASKLGMKLNETFSVLYNIADVMNEYHILDSLPLPSVVAPCNLDEQLNSETESIKRKSRNYEEVQEVLLKATGNYHTIKLKKHLKQVYFLSSFDVSNDFNLSTATINNDGFESGTHECNRQNQSLLWPLFTNYHRSTRRNVLLLLDHGGSLPKQQLRTVKELAQQLIDALSPSDRIGLVAIQSDSIQAATIPPEQCLAAPPSDVDSADSAYNVPLSSLQSDRLDSFQLWPATERHRRGLQQWIGNLNAGVGGTNHSLGLQWSLEALLSALTVNDTSTTVMVYVSRGLLASIADARPVLEIVAAGVEDLRKAGHGVMINTVAVIDESKPILFETQFLRDVAEQNYSQYNVESFNNDPVKGSLLTLNSSQSVGLTVARLLHKFEQSTFEPNYGPRLSQPRWDDVSRDIAVSVTIPWSHSITTYGVLGADLYFVDLVEDVAYFGSNVDYSYSFIVDMTGLSVAHPTYQLPLSIFEQPRFVDIRHLEKIPEFDTVRNRILTEFRGRHNLLTTNNETVQYIWEQVLDWYVVCIVVYKDRLIPKHPYKVHWPHNNDHVNGNPFLHYRLDMLPTDKLCLHLNQVATLDAGTLFLGPSCFKSPFSYTQSLDQHLQPSPQKIMAYLSDNTRLISNPGLREHIRDEVAALAIILDYLRVQHLGGLRSRYIVRRYVAGVGGVLLMYPGSALVSHFEPTRCEWYRKARAANSTVVFTPPYLDAGGAGYIVTIARATGHAVVAMDVTLGYVYKVVLDTTPECAQAQILKCFLMDEHGYLIYHTQLLDPNGVGPLERLHLIHKESFVANDLLGQHHRTSFVQKRLCVRYADNTLQRYYQLNNESEGYAQAQAHHGGCIRYQVAALPATNAFVGIVNASCDSPPVTFCPCSVVDRRCLNCNRMEQRECECPCECPLIGCGSTVVDHSQLPLCAPPPPTVHAASTFQHRPLPSTVPIHQLRQCLPIACDLLMTYDACLGALGCEWCRYDVNGEPLVRTRPFCTALATCWGGIVGARPPVLTSHHAAPSVEIIGATNDSRNGLLLLLSASADQTVSAPAPAAATALPPAHYSPAAHYSPVGPIVGAVIGMCLILVVLFFCQRSYAAAAAAAMQPTIPDVLDTNHHLSTAATATSTNGSSGGGCGGGGNNVRMSDLNLHDVVGGRGGERDRLRLLRPEDEEEDDVQDEDCGSGNDAAQAVLSPYCVFTGYRRPAQPGTTGESSDHGYSTMTPHDHDSEHMSFAPYRPSSEDPNAMSNKVEGPAPFTTLPLNIRNCIIAPVTVHRNMEATQM